MRGIPTSGLLALLLLAGCESAPPEGLPPATGIEQRAARELAEGRVQEARELFMQSSTQSSSPFISLIGLARCGIAAQDWPLFELSMEGAIRANPKSAESHDLIGRTLLLAARTRGPDDGKVNAIMATRFFAEAKRLRPDMPGLTHHVGVAQLLAGHPERAVALLERALQRDPRNEEVLGSVIVALKQLNRRKTLKRLLEALDKEGLLPENRRADLLWAREGSPPTSRPTEQKPPPGS